MKKRIFALFCALALLLALALPASGSGAAPTVYILAVNDKFCDLPGGAQPVSVNGTLYVPYTVFDKSATGVDLGVYYGVGLGPSTTITLYSQSPVRLVFWVNLGTCQDGDGNAMNFRATVYNRVPYVPAAAVCAFFGLQYSVLPTSNRGTLVRISNSAVSMSDSQFLSTGAQAMSTRYNNILQNMDFPSPPDVTPSSPPTPSSNPGGAKGDVRVYLAVDASAAEADLTSCFPPGTQALFLFSPDSLPAQSAFVRKAVAAGHSVGLTVSSDSLEEALAQLERGNLLLSHIARVRTRLVSAPKELWEDLAAAGWACWQPNVNETTSYAILAGVDLKRAVARVDLPASAPIITRVLPRLREDGYDLRQPLETDL